MSTCPSQKRLAMPNTLVVLSRCPRLGRVCTTDVDGLHSSLSYDLLLSYRCSCQSVFPTLLVPIFVGPVTVFSRDVGMNDDGHG